MKIDCFYAMNERARSLFPAPRRTLFENTIFFLRIQFSSWNLQLKHENLIWSE